MRLGAQHGRKVKASMLADRTYEVRAVRSGIKSIHYAVFRLQDGVRVSRLYSGLKDADAAIPGFERRDREAVARRRPCITCGTEIVSEGPHHRMCAACRSGARNVGAYNVLVGGSLGAGSGTTRGARSR